MNESKPMHLGSQNAILRYFHGREPLAAVVIVFLLGLIVFYKQIFGGMYFTYYGEAAFDSLHQFVPSYENMKDAAASGIPLWTFEQGLGANAFAAWPEQLYDPFNVVLYTVFGSNIVYGLAWIHILKLMLTALFCSLYLKKLGHKPFTCILIPVMLAFSGDMFVRGMWYHHAVDCFLFSFMFYAYECFSQDSKKWLLPIAGVLVVLLRPIYYPFLYGLMLVGYGLIRYLYENKWQFKAIFFRLLKAGALMALGYGLAAFFLLPMMTVATSSTRDTALAESLFDNVFKLTNPRIVATGSMSLFSSAIMGMGTEYRGNLSILESPTLYCGALALFLIALALIRNKGKRRAIFIVIIAIGAIYILSPFVRGLFNAGVSLNYFKTSSFVIPIMLLFIAAYGADELYEQKPGKAFTIGCFSVLGLYLLGLLYCHLKHFNLIDYRVAAGAGVIMLAFVLLLILPIRIRPALKRGALLILVSVEMVTYCFLMINVNRTMLSSADIAQRNLYWDGTSEAVSTLPRQQDGFYRVQKSYYSISFNDSQFQHYYGTDYYESFVNKYADEFMNEAEFTFQNYGDRVYEAMASSDFLNTLLSVRYLLTKEDAFASDAYTQIGAKDGGIQINENKHYLPLGVAYDSYLPEEEYEKLPWSEKAAALFGGFLPSEGMNVQGFAKAEYTKFNAEEVEYDISGLNGLDTAEFRQPMSYKVEEAGSYVAIKPTETLPKGTLRLRFQGTSKSDSKPGRLQWSVLGSKYNSGNGRQLRVLKGTNDYVVDIPWMGKPITELRLQFGSETKVQYTLDNLKLEFIGDDQVQSAFARADTLRENAMTLTSFTDSHIEGRIGVDKAKLLFFSIPFDEGWSAKVDGVQAPIERVNTGFCGIRLQPGDHSIELSYWPPRLTQGLLLSGLSAVIFVLVLVYPRLRRRFGGRRDGGV